MYPICIGAALLGYSTLMWYYANKRANAAEHTLQLLKYEYRKLQSICFKSNSETSDILDTAISLIRRILSQSEVDRSFWNAKLMELVRLRENHVDRVFENPKELL